MKKIIAALTLAFLVGVADAQEIDVSQVNGLPQKLQALQDQINAANAALTARIAGISLTPGPQGVPGAQGPQGAPGAQGPAGASYDPAVLTALQSQVAALGAALDALTAPAPPFFAVVYPLASTAHARADGGMGLDVVVRVFVPGGPVAWVCLGGNGEFDLGVRTSTTNIREDILALVQAELLRRGCGADTANAVLVIGI